MPGVEPGVSGYVGVFEGGGVKGIALAGAAGAALDAGIRFRRVVGTSAGALVGSLVAAGFDRPALESAVGEVDWRSLVDPRPLGRLPGFGPHLAMLMGRGVARGAQLERAWAALLRRRGIVTFADLPEQALRVVATDITHGRGVVLPDGLPAMGLDPRRFPVARAVRASASVPFLFEPVTLVNPATGERSVLVDGAFAARYPLQLVQVGMPTVGFRLVPPPESHEHHRIRGPIGLAAAVISAGMTARETLPVLCRNATLVVEVMVDHPPFDFDLDGAAAAELFESGRRQAAAQLPALYRAVGPAAAMAAETA